MSDIPACFVCTLTQKIFLDPVVVKTGQTFEKEAI